VAPESVLLVDGEREWVEYEDLAVDDEDFLECGTAFENAHPDAVERSTVGVGDATLLSQRRLVEFAVEWLEENRE